MEQNIPARISLGVFKANAENTFCFPLELNENAELYTDISGISVTRTAKTGFNTITVTTEEIGDRITVFGKIYVKSSAVHEIYVSGKADKNADVRRLFPVQICGGSIMQLQRGQRVLLNGKTENLKIMFASDYIPFEIDGYAFMVQTNGKVSRDEDMIFWGNRSSPDNSVRLENSLDFSIYPANLPEYVSKIAVCYSVYGNEADKTFRFVHNPYIRIFLNNVEKYNFSLDNLTHEKTIAGIEIYRHHENWKINCIGAGYNAGLKRMCEDYGLEVID